MPYRRLPNTDSARIRALRMAISKCQNTDFRDLPISVATLEEARGILMRFEGACKRYQQIYDIQINANKKLQLKVKNARMYLSHFVQVLYMCVVRSEIKEKHLALYGLDNSNMIVPDISSNELLLSWGNKIIAGETARLSHGGTPIYNPSIAKVKVMLSIFEETYNTQLIHRKSTSHALQKVADLRNESDKVILKIWEEVEAFNISENQEQRIDKNKEYGLIYYYRTGETTK